MYDSEGNEKKLTKWKVIGRPLNACADLSRLCVGTYWSPYQRTQKNILCDDLSITCVDTYWKIFDKFKNLILCADLYKFRVDT